MGEDDHLESQYEDRYDMTEYPEGDEGDPFSEVCEICGEEDCDCEL